MAYATVQDLTDYLDPDPVPDNASRLLARASRAVDQALLTAVYKVDDDGQPTDAKVAQALKDATLEQVAAWDYTGSEGIPTGYTNVSAGSISLGKGSGAAGVGDGTGLAPQAWMVLAQAGLTGRGPWEP